MSQESPRLKATLLFLHGAGGFEEDGPLASDLAESFGANLNMPRFSDTDMSFEGWAVQVRALLADLGPGDIVVGHSFGGSILVKVLAERVWAVRRCLLLAMPNWGPDGWNVEDYAFDGPEPSQSLTLHHCVDDAVVPFAHLALNAEVLPAAIVEAHTGGGHQFDRQASTLPA